MKFRNRKSGIGKSGIGNQEQEFRNRKSGIRNQEQEIRKGNIVFTDPNAVLAECLNVCGVVCVAEEEAGHDFDGELVGISAGGGRAPRRNVQVAQPDRRGFRLHRLLAPLGVRTLEPLETICASQCPNLLRYLKHWPRPLFIKFRKGVLNNFFVILRWN